MGEVGQVVRGGVVRGGVRRRKKKGGVRRELRASVHSACGAAGSVHGRWIRHNSVALNSRCAARTRRSRRASLAGMSQRERARPMGSWQRRERTLAAASQSASSMRRAPAARGSVGIDTRPEPGSSAALKAAAISSISFGKS